MHLESVVAAALLSTASALPSLLPRQDDCGDRSGERYYAATIGVYSDIDCLEPVEGYGQLCEYTDRKLTSEKANFHSQSLSKIHRSTDYS
jgi:hypothetical protein